jgi:hypothetical protein
VKRSLKRVFQSAVLLSRKWTMQFIMDIKILLPLDINLFSYS